MGNRRAPRGAGLAAACLVPMLWAALPGVADAQVRRGERGPLPQTGDIRGSGNVGNQRQVVANVQGGNRVNGNVNIGNEINIGRPRASAPVIVPVYPGYDSGPSFGEMVAVGVVAGATAGVVAGAMQGPSTTTIVTTAAPSGSTLEIGMRLAVLPSGCTTQAVGKTTYYRCGTAWVQSFMEGSQLVYVVVPTPSG